MSAVPAKQRASVSQSHSSLCTSSLQNFSAVCSCHSLPEAMLNLALTLLRLICSLHERFTPFPLTSYMTLLYIIYIFFSVCQELFWNLSCFFLHTFLSEKRLIGIFSSAVPFFTHFLFPHIHSHNVKFIYPNKTVRRASVFQSRTRLFLQ